MLQVQFESIRGWRQCSIVLRHLLIFDTAISCRLPRPAKADSVGAGVGVTSLSEAGKEHLRNESDFGNIEYSKYQTSARDSMRW